MKSLINISTANLEFIEQYIKTHKLTKTAFINSLVEEFKAKEAGDLKDITVLMTPETSERAFEFMMVYGIKNLGELLERITPEFLSNIREVRCTVKRNVYEYIEKRLKSGLAVECILEYFMNGQKK